MLSDLKSLARMIDIVTAHGHRVVTSAKEATGTAGPNVSFGCDQGGGFVQVMNGARLSLDDAKALASDLFNAIYYAEHREWLCDHGMAKRADSSAE